MTHGYLRIANPPHHWLRFFKIIWSPIEYIYKTPYNRCLKAKPMLDCNDKRINLILPQNNAKIPYSMPHLQDTDHSYFPSIAYKM